MSALQVIHGHTVIHLLNFLSLCISTHHHHTTAPPSPFPPHGAGLGCLLHLLANGHAASRTFLVTLLLNLDALQVLAANRAARKSLNGSSMVKHGQVVSLVQCNSWPQHGLPSFDQSSRRPSMKTDFFAFGESFGAPLNVPLSYAQMRNITKSLYMSLYVFISCT